MRRVLILIVSALTGVAAIGGLAACSTVGDYLQSPFASSSPSSDWAAGQFERLSYTYGPDARTLSYVQAGDPAGQRVLFIHGSPGWAYDWHEQLERVPAHRHYVAVDRPGYEFSKPHKAEPSLAAQASALAPLLDTQDGRPVILVGFSLGGPVAVRLALDYPDKVAGLVMASANLDPALEDKKWYNEVASWALFKPFIRSYWRTSNSEILPHKKELEMMAPRLASIKLPVAILHSRQDTLVPIGNVAYVREKLVNARIIYEYIDDGYEHMLPIHRPDLTAAAIEAVAPPV